MRHLNLLIPSLALVLLNSAPLRPQRQVTPAHDAEAGPAASANPNGMAEARARIPDASHQFLPDAGEFRADIPERGLTARFDDAGAHIAVGAEGGPISLHTSGVGRTGSREAAVATPTLGECQGKADPMGQCVPRLEYASGEFTEWWVASSGGFEQGWVVNERPVGSGPVRIDVAVGNADAEVEHSNLKLHDDNGSALVVSGLRAWDARGESLPVRFESGEDGFSVVVEDEGATYPVEVDPVYTTADWEVTGQGGLGDSVVRGVAAGDMNGDGYDDAFLQDSSGIVYLYEGDPSGVRVRPMTSMTAIHGAGDVNGDGYIDVAAIIDSETAGVYFGGPEGLPVDPSSTVLSPDTADWGGSDFDNISGAGDVNGDGYDDVVVAASQFDLAEGRVYLYLGGPSGMAETPATTLTGYMYTELGSELFAAGDVNGDGFADLLASAPRSEYSEALVYAGSETGLDASPLYDVNGGNYYIGSVASAGDVNGDGYDDVLITTDGCWINCHSYNGTLSLVLGSPTGPDVTIYVNGASREDWDSYDHVAGVGDVNGDGYDDIQVGSSLYVGAAAAVDFSAPHPISLDGTLLATVGIGDATGDGFPDVIEASSGSTSLYLGSDSADLSDSIPIDSTGDYLGAAIANAGDVNGDGYEDVILGAYGHDRFSGESLVYLGSPSGLGETPATTLLGADPDAQFGTSVAGAGDTNGDGYDDIVIGADGSGANGTAYVYLGSEGGIVDGPRTAMAGDSTVSGLGHRVAGIGDVNGDGYADVAIGMSPGSNSVWLYTGSASGIPAEPDLKLSLSATPSAIASAGDVNGDGFGDLAIGFDDVGAGEVAVFVGAALGPPDSPSTTLVGEAEGDHFGSFVSAAGDVDADGFGDLAIGANGSDGNTGRVYVFAGEARGVGASPQTTMLGTAANDQLGAWVGPAGDIDGDGYDDLLVAAPGVSGTGEILSYAGSATGVAATARSTATGFHSLGGDIATADVNGDGLLDYFASDFDEPGQGGRVGGWYGCIDADLDGYCVGIDCDDADPSTGALFSDVDGDGFGDANARLDACVMTAGVPDSTDCDDTNAAVNPAMDELCDDAEVDENCDGSSNGPDSVDAVTWYEDADQDGYPNPDVALIACLQPRYYAEAGAAWDCDDTDWDISPGEAETCDGIDNDCSGSIDDNIQADEVCDGVDNDCNGLVDDNIQAEEVCDGVDNDCDGGVDESSPGMPTWYPDLDGDGYFGSEPDETRASCEAPDGYSALTDPADCNDANPNIHPGATDPPGDAIDQNCNGRDTPGKSCGGCSTQPFSDSTLPSLFLALLTVRRRGGATST